MEGIKNFIEQHLVDLYNERDRVNELINECKDQQTRASLKIWSMHINWSITKYKSYKQVFEH